MVTTLKAPFDLSEIQPSYGDERFQTYQEYVDAITPLIHCQWCGSIITGPYCDNDQCDPPA